MKKYVLPLMLVATIVLASCGSGSTTTKETTDSTAVSVDTTVSVEKDTTVKVKTDSSAVK